MCTFPTRNLEESNEHITRIPRTMNNTSDFFGWLSAEPANVSMVIEKLESQPFLVGSDCSDFSSQDGSLHSRCESDFGKVKKVALPVKRRVSLNSRVEVREYSMTIGDHPCCNDGLPLTLDWAYSPEYIYRDIECSRERSRSYQMPRRLGFDEKRERLFEVGEYTDSEVRNEEINMVIRMLQHCWSQTNVLPALKIEEIIEEDFVEEEEEEEEEEKPSEPVIYWKRNRGPIRRAKSFCE
jgi:hypothetical protein